MKKRGKKKEPDLAIKLLTAILQLLTALVTLLCIQAVAARQCRVATSPRESYGF